MDANLPGGQAVQSAQTMSFAAPHGPAAYFPGMQRVQATQPVSSLEMHGLVWKVPEPHTVQRMGCESLPGQKFPSGQAAQARSVDKVQALVW